MAIAKFKAELRTYEDALAFLGGRVDRVLAHNTHVVNYGAGARIHVLYHGNVIATFYRDATRHCSITGYNAVPVVRLRDAGWSTVTTTGRLNRILADVMGATSSPQPVRINRQGGATRVTFDAPAEIDGAYSETLRERSLAIYANGTARFEVDVERQSWET